MLENFRPEGEETIALAVAVEIVATFCLIEVCGSYLCLVTSILRVVPPGSSESEFS